MTSAFSQQNSVSLCPASLCTPRSNLPPGITWLKEDGIRVILSDVFFFFSPIYFYQLEANYFTILKWLLSYFDMNQPWSYMYSPSIPPPTSLSTRFLWVFPVYQARALVSCIQPGLVICFTIDNIHVSMLFFQNIPPLPSPTESKCLFCTSVFLFLFCIQGYHYHLSKFHVYVLLCCNVLYLSGSLHSV